MNARDKTLNTSRRQRQYGDFRCLACHNPVSSLPILAGVCNRNHCSYCLWSRHVDLHHAGDRLSACKGSMEPVALTLKRIRNKYALLSSGELMLVHRCVECGKISINRIAADDDDQRLIEVFQHSMCLDRLTRQLISSSGISALQSNDTHIVRTRLYGITDAEAHDILP